MANTKSTQPVTSPSAARRGVLLGALMALAAPKAATAAPATVERVDAAAKALTAGLAELHGGDDWRTVVNHEHGFVLIFSVPGSTDGGTQ